MGYFFRCKRCGTYISGLRKRVTMTKRSCPECGKIIQPQDVEPEGCGCGCLSIMIVPVLLAAAVIVINIAALMIDVIIKGGVKGLGVVIFILMIFYSLYDLLKWIIRSIQLKKQFNPIILVLACTGFLLYSILDLFVINEIPHVIKTVLSLIVLIIILSHNFYRLHSLFYRKRTNQGFIVENNIASIKSKLQNSASALSNILPSLTNVNRINSDFSGTDLSGVNFSGSNLSEVNLSGTNLRNAILRDAKLNDAILHKADLRASDLRDADLSSSDLSYADLREADLRGANLENAKLRGAVYNELTKLPETFDTNHHEMVKSL